MKKFMIAVAAAVPVLGTIAASASAQAGAQATATPAQRVAAATRKVHNEVVFTQTIDQHHIEGKRKPGILSPSSDADLSKTLDR